MEQTGLFPPRVVCWFSCGAASAVASKLALAKYAGIGCVKGGMGYWNKIRVDFPETFARMAALEREIGATCNRDKAGSVYLDELAPDRGHYPSEPSISCGALCEIAEAQAAA